MPDIYVQLGDETVRILNSLCERLRKKGFTVAVAFSMERNGEGVYFPIFAPTEEAGTEKWHEQKEQHEMALTYAVADIIKMDEDAKGFDPATCPQGYSE